MADNTYKTLVSETMTKGMNSMALVMCKNTGILDELIGSEIPLTVKEVAEKRKLKERYVKELLNCLSVAKLVEIKISEQPYKYFLTPDEKKVLNDDSLLGLLAGIPPRFNDLRSCFDKDGPYGYSFCDDFSLFEANVPLLDQQAKKELNIMETRTEPVKELLEKGAKVLECGSGKGVSISLLGKRFPNSSFTASDYNSAMMDYLQGNLKEQNLTNVECIQLDLMIAPKEELVSKFDVILVSDVIHDLPYPQLGLECIHKMLKPDGYFVMFDFDAHSDIKDNLALPHQSIGYIISVFFCVPQAYNDETCPAVGTMWGSELATEYLNKAGFEVVFTNNQNYTGAELVQFVCKKSAPE